MLDHNWVLPKQRKQLTREAEQDCQRDEHRNVDSTAPIKVDAAQPELPCTVGLGDQRLHGAVDANNDLNAEDVEHSSAKSDCCQLRRVIKHASKNCIDREGKEEKDAGDHRRHRYFEEFRYATAH